MLDPLFGEGAFLRRAVHVGQNPAGYEGEEQRGGSKAPPEPNKRLAQIVPVTNSVGIFTQFLNVFLWG